MPEVEVGKVIHYFGNLGVAIVKFTDTFRIGEAIHIKGATTDFEQKVESMQIERQSFEEVKAKDEAGIKVKEKVREGDVVYRVELE